VLHSKRDLFLTLLAHLFDLHRIEIVLLAAVIVCRVSNKDRSVSGAMTNNDVHLVSRAQYTVYSNTNDQKS
jgi:hypothetical protein